MFRLGALAFFWIVLGRCLGAPGLFWSSWAALGRSWASLGRSWAALGLSWLLLGRSGALLGRSWALLAHSCPLLGRTWALLGHSWGTLGSSVPRGPETILREDPADPGFAGPKRRLCACMAFWGKRGRGGKDFRSQAAPPTLACG